MATCKECFNYDLCKIVSDKYCELNVITDNVVNAEKYCSLFKSKKVIDIAIKKQKPQKVIYEDVGYDCFQNENVYACICPSCELHIFEFYDSDIEGNYDFGGDPEKMFHSCLIHHAYRGLNNYCNRCGQKLDWR